MSLQASVGFQIPTNVVEVGNEISSDQLAAIQNASGATAANPFVVKSSLLRGIQTGSVSLDEGDNNYVYVLGNSETLTINDDSVNNPPIGSVFTILFIGTGVGGQVSVDYGVTINGGSSSYGQSSICTKLLIKTAANTWYIG
jgi:hypothetical protein